MRTLIRGLAAAAAVLVLGGTLSAGEIVWAPTFEAGVKKAKTKDLPVMIDIYTDWCGWCKKLDKDVYTNAQVVTLAKQFVSIKLNPEKDKKNGKLFKVEGFPAIIFLDSKGKEINRIGGYLPAEEFLGEMQKALDIANKGKAKAKGKEEPAEKEAPKEKPE
jgi:thiol:disulfide interchange protein